jgi:hypothetical protein
VDNTDLEPRLRNVTGVPKNIDAHLQRFVGAELSFLGIDQRQLQLHFLPHESTSPDQYLHLGIEGRWELHDASGHLVDQQQSHWTRDVYRIHALLGQKVNAYSSNPPEDFTLLFVLGYRLRVFATPDGYEPAT